MTQETQTGKKKRTIFNRTLWIILTAVFAVLMIAMIIGSYIAVTYASAAINMMFGVKPFEIIGETEEMRFESDWAEVYGEGLFNEDRRMIRKASAEGMVLLWNKDVTIDGQTVKALPIPQNSKLSTLSHSAVDIAENGGGSGAIDDSNTLSEEQARKTTLKDALNRYYAVNDDLWRFYESGDGSEYTRREQNTGGWPNTNTKWYVNEVPWSVYTDDVKNTFSDYGDAAIVVISRIGGENSDLYYSTETSVENGGCLALTQEEKDLLQNVTDYRKNGTFDRVVLVLNTSNTPQMSGFEPYLDGIDAAIYMGLAGSAGVNALTELLVGNESPSGRLADTLVYNVFSHPSTVGDGRDSYSNFRNPSCGNNSHSQHYTVYQEGIYVGYKYFETRYTDGVLDPDGTNALSSAGAANSTDGWDYDEEVAFPFGYGQSYTDFEWSDFGVSENGDNYDVSVTVTNTGSAASKEVVQVYLSKPYTEHDEANGIEVSAVELAAFGKTQKLDPGTSETITVSVPAELFKTYDATYDNGDGTQGRYVVEAGDYYLTAAPDSHTAANNVITARGGTPEAAAVMEGETRSVGSGGAFVSKLYVAADSETYRTSTQTGEAVYNQLDSMDINRYENRGDNRVTYLSRKDWNGTYPKKVQLSANDELLADLAITFVTKESPSAENPMPTYGKFASGSTDGFPDVDNGDLVAYDFIDAPLNKYDERWNEEWEQKWNQLLDQMTWDEQATMCTNAYHQIYGAESISLPYSKQENGPVGITKRAESNFQIPNKDITDWTYVCYPNAQVLASTFNTEIVEQVGQHKSEDMLYLGYNGIYGPGVNIHRSPFGGRNWEYYSEDPILSGVMGMVESRGIENKGCLAYAKHFCFNDMETYRHYNGIWMTEQTARELYLRAFEICFEEASATMNSFTRVGTRWSGMSKELQTNILRTEWGWDGLNITDWVEDECMSKTDALLAGTNTFDGNGTPETYLGGWENDPNIAAALRESAKIIIYNVVSTHVMNGVTRSTITREITPWWESTLYGIIAVFAVLTAASAAMLTVSIIKRVRAKKAAACDPPTDGTVSETAPDGGNDKGGNEQ